MLFRFVSINGVERKENEASISIWDTSFHRGDGVFEVMRLLPTGEIRSLSSHLKRLQTSADAVGCPLPNHETLTQWILAAAAAVKASSVVDKNSPGSLRLISTKGGIGVHDDLDSSTIISWAAQPQWPDSFDLLPMLAPWHPAGSPGWETPIKWTSYGPNVVSTGRAKAHGFSDALLLTSSRLTDSMNADLKDCHVLDGPNFAISWICNNTLYIPDSQALGLLPSITQSLVEDLAKRKLKMNIACGIHTLQDMLNADAAFVTSTTRGIIPVLKIGDYKTFAWEKNSFLKQLQELLKEVDTVERI